MYNSLCCLIINESSVIHLYIRDLVTHFRHLIYNPSSHPLVFQGYIVQPHYEEQAYKGNSYYPIPGHSLLYIRLLEVDWSGLIGVRKFLLYSLLIHQDQSSNSIQLVHLVGFEVVQWNTEGDINISNHRFPYHINHSILYLSIL